MKNSKNKLKENDINSIIHIDYWDKASKTERLSQEYVLFLNEVLNNSLMIVQKDRKNNYKELVDIFNRIWKLNLSAHNITFSKTDQKLIKRFIDYLSTRKKQIMLHFYFDSLDNEIINTYQLNNPPFEEQLEILKYAYKKGFRTIVSCRPMLDTNAENIIETIKPFVTDSIRIELADNIIIFDLDNEVNIEKTRKAEEIKKIFTKEYCLNLYNKYKDDALIKWNDFFRKILKIKTLPDFDIAI